MAVAEQQAIASVLAPDEPPPYEVIEGQRPILLTCDHAGRRIPRSLDSLGVSNEYLEDHIAWDVGAAGVTRHLAAELRASAVLGVYSRLVVDPNRDLEDVTAFPRISDGVLIPGNLNLDVETEAERARAIFKPYHEAVRRVTQANTTDGQQPVLISMHSFTPYLHCVFRPWEIGVLWDKDSRLPLPLMAALRATGEIIVGDNRPYSGRHPADFTVDHHAEPLGLAHAGIEIRQDLIHDDSGQARWAHNLASVLELVLEDEGLYNPLG